MSVFWVGFFGAMVVDLLLMMRDREQKEIAP